MFAALAAWFAKSALMMSPVGRILSAIGRGLKAFFGALNVQGWIGLVAALLLGWKWLGAAGEARHWHKQSDRYEALYNGEVANEAKIAKQAVDLKTRIDALTSSITKTVRDMHDAEDRRIASDADAIRLRGPGKATCPSSAGASSAAVRHDAATGADAGPQVSSGDWAAVPWNWLVQVVEEHDQLLNKVKAAEEQHTQLEQAWPKSEGAKK